MLLARRPARKVRIKGPTALLLAVTTGQVLVLGHLGWSSNYWYDDLLYLEQVKRGDISLHHMTLPMFGHMAPGHNFVYWALQHFAPGRYHVALLVELIISAAITLVLARVLRLLTHRRMLSAVLASLFAMSATQVSAFAWLAAAADCIFATLFTLLAAERFLVWRVNRRPLALFSCLALWAVGLSFYEETAFLPVWLAAVFAFVLPDRWSWDEARRELMAVWQAWVGFAVVGLAWIVLYAAGPYGDLAPRPSPGQAAGFLWTAWFKNFWITAVGAPALWGLPQGGLVVQLVGEAVFVLLVAVTVARRHSAWRAWIFFIASFVLHVGVIAYGRAAWGAVLGKQSFYVYESGWLLAITVVCAIGPPSASRSAVAEVPAPSRTARPRQARLVSAGLVAVLLVVAGVRGATSAGTTFHNFPGRFVTMWVANVQTTAAEIRRTGRPFTVFDAKPPLYFAQLNFPDTNRLSVMLGTGYAHFTYDKPGLPSYFVDPIGRLVRGDLSVQGRWKPQQGTVECWTGLKVLTLSHAAKDDSLFLRLRTDQPAPVQVRISVRAPGTQDAFANDTDGLINIPAGRSDLLIPMRPTLATAVLVNTDGPAVCINGVQLGAPAPLTTD